MNEICPRCAVPLGLDEQGWPDGKQPVWITVTGIACSEECARSLTGNRNTGYGDGRRTP